MNISETILRFVIPENSRLFKFNNWNTRKRYEIRLKLTMKTPEQRHWRRSGIFIVNFERISHLSLFLFLTLNRKIFAGNCRHTHKVIWYTKKWWILNEKWNMFKVSNNVSRTTSVILFWCLHFELWAYFTPFSSVSIFDLVQLNIFWDGWWEKTLLWFEICWWHEDQSLVMFPYFC